MILIQVESGTVEATHTHTQYGPCIVIDNLLRGIGIVRIRTNNGTAAVPTNTLSSIK